MTDDERRSEAITAPPGPVKHSSLHQINLVDRSGKSNSMSETSVSGAKTLHIYNHFIRINLELYLCCSFELCFFKLVLVKDIDKFL